MQYYSVETKKVVSYIPEYVHFKDDNVEIRSSYKTEDILNVDILSLNLPGELSSYIYPKDSVLCIKKGLKLKDVLKYYEKNIEPLSQKDDCIVFDVEKTIDEEDIVEDDDYEESEEEEEEDEGDGEVEEWEDDEDVEEQEQEQEQELEV